MNSSAHTDSVRLVRLENEWLRASLLPCVGAKIFDLISKSSGKNYLWHNEEVPPHPFPVDAILDDHWCGGWDDGFPTCDPCEFRDKKYECLGELRSVEWNSVQTGPMEVELCTRGQINSVAARKIVRLSPHSPVLSIRFDATNLGPHPLDFMWGTHPAVRPFGDNLKLIIPARTGIVVEGTGTLNQERGRRFSWPMLGDEDMGRIGAADSGAYYGLGATDLEAGWYAIEDEVTGEGLAVAFRKDVCPYLWLWLNYGGYRGHRHVIIEPWTSFPMTLAAAAEAGTSRLLAPGATFSAEIAVAPYRVPETRACALAWIQETQF